MKTLIASLTALTLGLGSLAAFAVDTPARPGTSVHKSHNKVHKASHKAHKKLSARHHAHSHA